ncbi:pentatricopeptide repeat-containing protein At5g43790-like [Papaver somniferum]|uniref:pentatricopeptide repeat-containing protein At5g43790-like n=1 Tax=Papaver somniferum TaxID=3469 RepID=UPI000E6F48FB|nr:pentatricopeptide repeat-containing protein At5g43790-like [Papaver somniferum]
MLQWSSMKPEHLINHPTLILLGNCKSLTTLKKIHAQMITTGLILHTFPLSRILLYSSTLSLTYSLTIFNQIINPSIFLYNTLISSFASNNNPQIAFSLYSQILTHKTLKPNNFTYPSLFKACGSHPSWLHHGIALHTHVLKFLEPHTFDHFVQASLVNFYSKFGNLGLSRFLFNQIKKPDLATWNSILAAYANPTTTYTTTTSVDEQDTTGLAIEVLCLFNEMLLAQCRPNEVTLVAVITACAKLGAFTQGSWAYSYILRNNLKLNRFVITSLIDMYAKCGWLDFAKQLFDQIPDKDVLCYNVMIRGFAVHGYGHQALSLFNEMKVAKVQPDDVTFVVALCACAHVGLVEDGYSCFNSMKDVYGIEPKVEHYACLVDLLARGGLLDEAHRTISTMPMKPNAVLWRSLLGASRVHENLGLGELALRNLIELEPRTSGNYVLLSNMYAKINRWDSVKEVRKAMKNLGVSKLPGSSLIEIDGVLHEFLMGDKTHPSSKEIYVKLEETSKRLNTYGYNSVTREVLFDIEEEEKEDALNYHSERLAIAFALIQVPSNSSVPIRIIKNLRVCSDCHESTKLISKIYGRGIIVRDRNRFHHFKDGTCSCLDYW